MSEPSVLIGTCAECGHWFPMDEPNESCPADTDWPRSHHVVAYVQLDRVISYRTSPIPGEHHAA